MSVTTAAFLEAVALTECSVDRVNRAFLAVPQPVPWPKAYGGDLVAQSAAAAIRTVSDDRVLHSLHGTFLRGVETEEPVQYEVEDLRDGRGYSTRHIRGYQHGRLAFMSTASFHVPEQFVALGPTMPSVPHPESLPSSAEVLESETGEAAEYWSHGRSFDMRHVPGPVYIDIDGGRVPHQAVWVKAFTQLPDDATIHRLAIAYVCDYTILEPILRVLGLPWSSPGLVTASLDHAMWFHSSARADQWLLYAQECAGISEGRGLGIGRFFTQAGALVATVAQEGMIRPGQT
ncbi:acyl-CoA thioesterase [Leucobacter denitrificans]|uniref:Thioesterase family protein n=1 Tax=Leucobacter denitrificans TaxID=683042 RepID=A0A7G9S2S7_9MICO|nr:acyl-CoA thioesterase domain-containing protein [Leucobacter denitrificans]QNN62152.1 thioesterase family protein [Leucobacter denitrificans]